MRDGIERAKRCTGGWNEIVAGIEDGKAMVNKEMNEALKKTENTKQEYNARIMQLSSLLQEAINKQITQIQVTNWNSIRQLDINMDDINQKKSAIDRLIEKMDKQLREDHESEVIKHSQESMAELEEILKHAAHINEKRITTKIPVYNQPNFERQINIEDFGWQGWVSDATMDIGPSKKKWETKSPYAGHIEWCGQQVDPQQSSQPLANQTAQHQFVQPMQPQQPNILQQPAVPQQTHQMMQPQMINQFPYTGTQAVYQPSLNQQPAMQPTPNYTATLPYASVMQSQPCNAVQNIPPYH